MSLTWTLPRNTNTWTAKGNTHTYRMGYLTFLGTWAVEAFDNTERKVVWTSEQPRKRDAQYVADLYETNRA